MNFKVFKGQTFTYDDLKEAVQYGLNYNTENEELQVPQDNLIKWLSNTIERTAEEWQKLDNEILIINQEGWDKTKKWKKDWYTELITYEEYIRRRENSTCINSKKHE